MKSETWWFVLPRFGSCKPTPRWGGHKDRVSFNPFPLSNGHLDRVSFSSQSIGTLSPHKDHHTIGVTTLSCSPPYLPFRVALVHIRILSPEHRGLRASVMAPPQQGLRRRAELGVRKGGASTLIRKWTGGFRSCLAVRRCRGFWIRRSRLGQAS
jgi:hypothetical protein